MIRGRRDRGPVCGRRRGAYRIRPGGSPTETRPHPNPLPGGEGVRERHLRIRYEFPSQHALVQVVAFVAEAAQGVALAVALIDSHTVLRIKHYIVMLDFLVRLGLVIAAMCTRDRLVQRVQRRRVVPTESLQRGRAVSSPPPSGSRGRASTAPLLE